MNTTELEKRESALSGEQFDIEFDVCDKLSHLIAASWDSNTLKRELEVLIKQHHKVIDELCKVWDEKDKSK